MSKTLFNTNTFNSKNVTNSNAVTNLKVDEIKATNATITNATITNITNSELQAATANIAINTQDIQDISQNFENFQPLLTPGNQLDANFIDFSNNAIIQNISTNGGNITINGDSTGDLPQLIVTDAAVGGRDAILEIRGKRNGSIADKHAEIRLTNYDRDTPTTHLLGLITGEVTNATLNKGDMVFYSSSNGILQTEAMRIESVDRITISSSVTMDARLTVNARINATANIITTADFIGVGATFSGLTAGSIVTATTGGELSVATTSALTLDTAFTGYTSGALQTALDGKETAFDVSAPLFKNTGGPTPLLYIDKNNQAGITIGSNQLIDGGGIYQYLLTNYNKKIINQSPLQLNITDSGGSAININDRIAVILATGASQTDFGLVNGKVLDDELATKQDSLIAGTNITIDGTNTISATNTTYTAATNGGLSLSGTEFSLDFTNTNSTITIPQKLEIVTDTTDSHVLIKTSSDAAQDAILKLEGARSGCTGCKNSQILFSNYDTDIATAKLMGCITGQQTDTTNNYGKLSIYTSADGVNLTETMKFEDDGQTYILGNAFFQGATTQSKRMVSYDANTDTVVDNRLTTVFTGASYSNFDENFKLAAPVYRNAYIGLLGDGGTTNGNVLAMALDGGGGDDPNIVFAIDADGNCEIAGEATFDQDVTCVRTLYRVPQIQFYNFDPEQLGNNSDGNQRWGGTGATGNPWGIQDTLSSTRNQGNTFSSHSAGTITFSESGFYRIRASANPQTKTATGSYGDRLAFMIFLRIDSTDYAEDPDYNFFGWSYTRNGSDGAHGSFTFEDYIYISSGSTLQIRNRLDINNVAFDDTLAQNQMQNYLNLQIERIYE